jgi:hypothetical protein
VPVLVAKDEKRVEVKDVSLTQGIDLKFGTLQARAGLQPRRSIAVTYQGSRPLKSVTFLDGNGTEITQRQGPLAVALAAAGIRTENRFRAYFILEAQVDRCTVRVLYFDTVETIDVPLDLEVGLGL